MYLFSKTFYPDPGSDQDADACPDAGSDQDADPDAGSHPDRDAHAGGLPATVRCVSRIGIPTERLHDRGCRRTAANCC